MKFRSTMNQRKDPPKKYSSGTPIWLPMNSVPSSALPTLPFNKSLISKASFKHRSIAKYQVSSRDKSKLNRAMDGT